MCAKHDECAQDIQRDRKSTSPALRLICRALYARSVIGVHNFGKVPSCHGEANPSEPGYQTYQ